MFIDNLKVACAQKGTSPTALLKSIGMSSSSVTAWKNGVKPSLGTVYRIAKQLEVNPATLLEGWSNARIEDEQTGNSNKAPTLTKKDERDIARDLQVMVARLEDGGDMMFDGDPMTDEARESIVAAMRLGLEAAKAKNKARFTPKKYRKE